MLKIRIIPILTFNGFGLVKTKTFATPRMVGNPVQATRVYNSRGVDELVFLDIFASEQKRKINLKLVGDVIKECYMPVAIGGGIKSIEDINSLLKIGADKVVIKTHIIEHPEFIDQASDVFGAQCITIAVDAIKKDGQYYVYNKLNKEILLLDFLKHISNYRLGEIVLTSVNNDGHMNGFDIELVNLVEKNVTVPIVAAGGGGEPKHFEELFSKTNIEAVGAASIFHFTQYTPHDLKKAIGSVGKPVRILKNSILTN
jgi:imidazole glycerol-phosphate synthase subunit HisF